MTTSAKLLTAEEFAALPEPPGAGKMELVAGEVRCMAPVGLEHGSGAGSLTVALWQFARRHGLGVVGPEIGYILARGPDIVRSPDVSFLAASRIPPPGADRGFVEGPPDLAVEVNSPNDHAWEIQEKVEQYLAAGTRRVWVVEPVTRTVTVHRPGGDSHTHRAGDTLTSDDAGFAVEGFTLPLNELFA